MSERLAVAQFLPGAAKGRTTVLVKLHSAECEGCRHYLDQLAASAAEFEVWGASLVVAPGPSDDAAVIVADQYGQIYDAVYTGGGHQFPAPRQLEEWLKFLGTLCPE